jgi:uncharacterized protein YbaA (DUF1428 family)
VPLPSLLELFCGSSFYSRPSYRRLLARGLDKELEGEMNKPENKDKPIPFDMKRLAYGGFEVIVEA